MSSKTDYMSLAPEVAGSLFESGKLLAKSGLEPAVLVLIQIRASQINRCAFCLALHAREAEAIGESLDRIATIPAWREAAWYSERERLALELTEALTRVAEAHPPRGLLDRLKEHYTEREIVYLILAISTINTWNRFNVALHTSPEGADDVFKMLHRNGAPAHA